MKILGTISYCDYFFVDAEMTSSIIELSSAYTWYDWNKVFA